jgi:hypothetical protein
LQGNIITLSIEISPVGTIAASMFCSFFQRVPSLENLKSVALTSMLAAVWGMKKYLSWLRRWGKVSILMLKFDLIVIYHYQRTEQAITCKYTFCELNQGNSLRTLQFTHCCDIFELAYETQ